MSIVPSHCSFTTTSSRPNTHLVLCRPLFSLPDRPVSCSRLLPAPTTVFDRSCCIQSAHGTNIPMDAMVPRKHWTKDNTMTSYLNGTAMKGVDSDKLPPLSRGGKGRGEGRGYRALLEAYLIYGHGRSIPGSLHTNCWVWWNVGLW